MLQLQFYWDVYFFLNSIMNVFLLLMTAMLRRKGVKFFRLFVAALAGSGEMTMCILLYFWFSWKEKILVGKFLLIAGGCLSAGILLSLCFGNQGRTERRRTFVAFLQVSIFTGGALLLCREWLGSRVVPSVGMVLTATFLLTVIFRSIWCKIPMGEVAEHVVEGVIYDKQGNAYPLRVLVDTGNHLVSPYTGEQVAILQQALGEKMGLTKEGHPVMIPFHSIGGEGVLPAYRIPRLVLHNGEEKRDFPAALTRQLSQDDAIKLIMYSEK